VALEDVGLADPLALRLSVAAKEAYEALGSPEGELALVEAAVYLALAPKSNSLYQAWKRAQEAARAHPEAPVPLNLRNAPTALARALGHGEGYAYYHEDKEGSFAQRYLPEGLSLYEATGEGFEERVRERLKALRGRFQSARPPKGGLGGFRSPQTLLGPPPRPPSPGGRSPGRPAKPTPPRNRRQKWEPR
jgi:putative ATPase